MKGHDGFAKRSRETERITSTCSRVCGALLFCLESLETPYAEGQLNAASACKQPTLPASTERHTDESSHNYEAAVGYDHAKVMKQGVPLPCLCLTDYLRKASYLPRAFRAAAYSFPLPKTGTSAVACHRIGYGLCKTQAAPQSFTLEIDGRLGLLEET